MTIIDKLLVLFDDKKARSLEEVYSDYTDYTSQVLSSSMGRLVSRGWLMKTKTGKKYQITKGGREFMSLNLECLSNIDEERSPNFYFLMFNIPEKQRLARDIIRVFLKKVGFGQLHNAVWISYKKYDKELDKIIEVLKIKNKTISFSVKITSLETVKIIKLCQWNLSEIKKDYNEFIKVAKKFLASKNKKKIPARNLVYQLAVIVRKDPLIPFEYYPKDFFGKTAFELYYKIRKYCY